MKITAELLKKLGACKDKVSVFKREWPEGATVTKANCLRAVALDLDCAWLAHEVLSDRQLKVYEEARALAEKAHYEARALAQKVYEEARAPAWKVYEEARALAEKAHYEAHALAWKAYKEAIAPAQKAYNEATALGFWCAARAAAKEKG